MLKHHVKSTSRRPEAASRGLSLAQSVCLVTVLALNLAQPGWAATSLADQPLFSNSRVPGNLALALSVEFPTAVSVAHVDPDYAAAKTFLGYFDPEKCYVYQPVDVETATTKAHFYPAALATSHTCVGTSDYMWSGNFLNWATMQTIDPFRWVLTGGYRVVDTATTTLLEKGWASGQGGEGNFPVRNVPSATEIAGATPFTGTNQWFSTVQGRGVNMELTVDGVGTNGGMLGTYFNSVDLSGPPVLTRTEVLNFDWGYTSPGPGLGDVFSARWVSSQIAPSTGTYRFRTTSDDGVRLWVNGVKLSNDATSWVNRGATTDAEVTVALNAGDPLNIRVEYFDSGGGAYMKLEWRPPGVASYAVYKPGDYLSLPIRVKVCDPTALGTPEESLEANCKAYAGGNYKPEGLMQQYAKKIRYSVFGYLNDDDIQRDAGVLRAQQKFVAPTYPVPGLPDATNTATEWNATTGVYIINPDGVSKAMPDSPAETNSADISNSGALNYLNKFGSLNRGNYKTYDPVGELYYAALRYYKNLGNISAWSDPKGQSKATRTVWADGFPVFTSWNDPIQYACQKNFILGIGDVNSHADKNVPGTGIGTGNEPSRPAGLSTDPFDAKVATNKVGVLQGLGTSLGSAENYNGCCNNNSALMSGLAYFANTKDIRPDNAAVPRTVGKQTVQTYWLDVLEYQTYKANNQFYLAAKYGGFKVPSGYNPDTNTTALPTSLWHTDSPVAADNTVGSGGSLQTRPDNYFTASRPDQVVDGLTKAFADIAAKSGAVVSSNSVPSPQVASGGGNISYASSWDGENWTGELIANELTFEGDAKTPTFNQRWALTDKLATQLAGTGWDTNRRVITWNTTTNAGVPFRATTIASTQLSALATPYASGDTTTNYLEYLRGNRTLEGSKYRIRTKLLGDIVGARPRVVGPPNQALSNSSNPGYSAFKTTWAARPTVVYLGSNDGMVRAVRGKLTGTDAGQEMWAYVPGALFQGPTATPSTNGLAALGNTAFEHRYFVNATPVVYDVDMGKTVGSTTGTQWRSLLIGGLGKGGKSYYAIDVTDPESMIAGATNAAKETAAAGKVLWEFSDSRLGYTYGEPQVVKTKQHGWVVILPSGHNNADGKGYIFILNPRTGAVIQTLTTNVGDTTNDAGLAELQTFVLDRTDATADSIYAGDLLGNVWRVDLTATTGAYPAPTKVAVLTDTSGTAQPITTRPLIEIHPKTKRRYILIGTGKLLATGDITNTQNQSFYAIIDGNNAKFNLSANLPSGVTFPIPRNKLVTNTNPAAGVTVDPSTQMGWVTDLGASWRVVSNGATFFGTVTFAPTYPSGDECSAQGVSRVYSLDFDTGKSELLDTSGSGVSYVNVYGADETTPILINEIQNFSESGTRGLTVGKSDGSVERLNTRPVTTPPVRRLNWRELPVAN